MRAATVLTVPAALALVLGACAPKPASQTVSGNQVGQVSSVYFGTVTALRAVDIAPGSTRLGAITGAIIGGAAGSTIGSRFRNSSTSSLLRYNSASYIE